MALNKSFSESESDILSCDVLCESVCETSIGTLTNILTDFSTERIKAGRPKKDIKDKNSTWKQDSLKNNSKDHHSSDLQKTLEFILREISAMRSDMGSLDRKVTDALHKISRLEQKISKIENENLKLKKEGEEKDTLIAKHELRLGNI